MRLNQLFHLHQLAAQLLYNWTVCLWQNDLSLPSASSRNDGSTAKVIRIQFFSPTAVPETTAQFVEVQFELNKLTVKIKHLEVSSKASTFFRFLPGRMMSDSSLASLKQKSISSPISSRRSMFNLTYIIEP